MLDTIRGDVEKVLLELQEVAQLKPEQVLVIGASSSEVVGKRIGTSGSKEAAKEIVEGVLAVQQKLGFAVAFQCCEHLNRALVLTQETAVRYGWEPVSVIPVPTAGGSVAAYAYQRMPDAVVVESVQAHAGIDIGDTLIGMHLKPVAVPVRATLSQIGEAHVTLARTRPKLIGGNRAVYEVESSREVDSSSTCT